MLPIVQIVRRPGMLELGWGHPDPDLLPVDALRRAALAAFDTYGADTLQYGYAAGPGPLLAWLIEHIRTTEGRAPAPDEIMITGGNSSGLDQLLTLCTAPGDLVLVESPTYHLAVRILRDHPLELAAVPSDTEGLNVEALKETLTRLERSGRRARALYTVPTFNNPTGISLSAARRTRLVQVAAAHDLLILEDDVYRALAYDAPAPPSLWSLAPPGVVARLGSFSKSLAPGLRLGWLTAGRDTIARLTGGGLLDSGGGINHTMALIAASLCASGEYTAHVERLRGVYWERRDALLGGLARALPEGCAWTVPGGGFFVYVTLPNTIHCDALLARAEARGVSFAPGTLFYPQGGGAHELRLAFTLYPPDGLVEAAERLGAALRDLLE